MSRVNNEDTRIINGKLKTKTQHILHFFLIVEFDQVSVSWVD